MSLIEKQLDFTKKGIVHAMLARQAIEALKAELRENLIEACLIHNTIEARKIAIQTKEIRIEENRLNKMEGETLERFEDLVPNFIEN